MLYYFMHSGESIPGIITKCFTSLHYSGLNYINILQTEPASIQRMLHVSAYSKCFLSYSTRKYILQNPMHMNQALFDIVW